MTLSTPDRGLAVVDALPGGSRDARRTRRTSPDLQPECHRHAGHAVARDPRLDDRARADGERGRNADSGVRPRVEPDAPRRTARQVGTCRCAVAGRLDAVDPCELGADRRIFERGRGVVVVSLLEVTEGYRLRMQAEHRATHDPLTGLANRVLFDGHSKVLDELARPTASSPSCSSTSTTSRRSTTRWATGPATRSWSASPSGSPARPPATPSRASAATSSSSLRRTPRRGGVAEAIAERIRPVLEATAPPRRAGTRPPGLDRGRDGRGRAGRRDGADLLRNADSAMYRAKRTGRGVALFDDRMRVAAVERMTLESGLRRALADGHLELHYQPVVDLGTTEWTSAEALVRWRDPVLGQIAPGRFIPVAKDSGLILQVGAWVAGGGVHTARRLATRRRRTRTRHRRQRVAPSADEPRLPAAGPRGSCGRPVSTRACWASRSRRACSWTGATTPRTASRSCARLACGSSSTTSARACRR